tara:strand:+ start:955 stop:1239 length:285 start_codon:yes stop_codon:yes gene_type:complete
MVGNNNNNNNTNEEKTGISIPLSMNVPDTIKLDAPQETEPQPHTRESCPPCPPCARCPEPSFECKKVPKYRHLMINDHNQIPRPINPDYTTFAV